ncbi:hypothetical protein GCM10025873_23430 [Demequina sediminis]|nr:hypothetical protein GCM10025873_23430 [Demequina sediminis]
MAEREAAAADTSGRGVAGVVTEVALVAGPAGAAPASITVPHAWHSPHRPTHFTAVQPHSVQRYPGDVLRVVAAMRSRYRRGQTPPSDAAPRLTP